MKEIIYLVGQISPKFEITYEWRKNVTDHFMGRQDIEIINPCANPFNRKVLKENNYAVTKNSRVYGIDLLPSKDLTYVKRSTLAIVNMNQYDAKKPLLGSYFELAWYFMHPEKAVIAFASDLNDYQCQHPFVQKTVHTWAHDEEQACYLVDQYFTCVEEN